MARKSIVSSVNVLMQRGDQGETYYLCYHCLLVQPPKKHSVETTEDEMIAHLMRHKDKGHAVEQRLLDHLMQRRIK